MTKTNVSVLKRFAMISSVLLFNSALFAQPQSPPTLTVAHTSTGPIAGGVAQYTDGSVYFSTLSTSSSSARVTGVTAANAQKWVFTAPGSGSTHNMWAIPALNATGTRLFIGSDAGNLFCLDGANGSVVWTYVVPTGTDRKIRSGVALDPIGPNGSTVYFHCNNTRLYAVNADNGTIRWSAITGNIGAPVDTTWHTETVSSSPIVGADGTVYVGSSDGSV